MTFPTYATGTVSIDDGETIVAGADAIWLFPNAKEGDMISIDGLAPVVILSVNGDDTELSVPEWTGGAKVAVDYVIFQTSPMRFDGGEAMLGVAQLISYWREQGTIYAVSGSEPDPSIGEENQFALKTNAAPWRFWKKTGGVWVEQAVPVGTTYRGLYDAGVDYIENDIAGYNGSSWIVTAPNGPGTAVHAPPTLPTTSNAWWDLFVAKGDKGDTGTAGKTILNGNGAPSNGLGADGDFYIATNTAFIYGPKASGAWPAGSSIIGPTGPQGVVGATGNAGADGKTLRYGSGAPSNGLGVDGDFYIDLAADDLYGPKAGGAWPLPGSLIGPQGSPGPVGQGMEPDATGTLAQRDDYDGEARGFAYLQTDVVPFLLYYKRSNTSADWSDPSPIGAATPLGSLGSIADSVLSSFSLGAIA